MRRCLIPQESSDRQLLTSSSCSTRTPRSAIRTIPTVTQRAKGAVRSAHTRGSIYQEAVHRTAPACVTRASRALRHSEHAHLLSNIEKLPLPILGSMFPFWNPTGVFLQSVAHVEKDKPSLFVASLQSTSFVVSPAEGEGAPGSSGPVHSGHTAQHGSEDVTVRSVSVRMRCLTDGLSSDNTVDFMHAFATPSRELRLA